MSRLTTTGLVGLATALSVSMLAAQAGSQAQSTGAITGTVIDGSTGTAVPGAVVQLTRPDRRSRQG